MDPLRRSDPLSWITMIFIECNFEGCDNVLTPRGVQLLSEINNVIETDPDWPNLCMAETDTNTTCLWLEAATRK